MMKTSLLIFYLTAISATALQAQIGDFADTDFSKADSIAARYPGHSVTDLYSLSWKLTNALATEQEKFRAIYKWVCDNIENDYSLFQKNQRQRQKLKDTEALARWNRKITHEVFETLRLKHKTVCTGYAYLLRELAAYAGISCEIIDGYGRNAIANIGGQGRPNHSWNAVYLNNKWYLCDATWSSGAIDLEKRSFVRKYDDSYFLLEPALFVRNHYPLDSAWILFDQKPTLHQFLNRPLMYGNAFDFKIAKLLPDTFNISAKKSETILFQFKTESGQIIETITLQISGPAGTSTISPSWNKNGDGTYFIEHTVHSKGTHVLQMQLNGDYVFCYRVDVK
jgi:hypothetical protein